MSRAGVAERIDRLDQFARRAESLLDVGDDRDQTLTAAVAFCARSTIDVLPYARDLTLVASTPLRQTAIEAEVDRYIESSRQRS